MKIMNTIIKNNYNNSKFKMISKKHSKKNKIIN